MAMLSIGVALSMLGLTPAMAADATPTPFASTSPNLTATVATTSPSTSGTSAPVTPASSSTSATLAPTRPASTSSAPAIPPTTATATRPPTPPASTSGTVPISSAIVALAVLAAVSFFLVRIARRSTDGTTPVPAGPAIPSEPDSDVLVAMALAGDALIDSGFDVNDVQADVHMMGRAYGVPGAEIIVLPTAVLVSARAGGQLRTGVVSSGRQRLRLHQTEELVDVIRGAQAGSVGPHQTEERIEAIRAQTPPFPPGLQLVGQVLTTVGLAVILGASWYGLAFAAGLGALAGGLLLIRTRVPARFGVLVNVATSFAVALTVFLVSRTGVQVDVVPCLIAPLVTLLPGALLTTSVIELVTGQMISGAGRLAAGAAQLVLLGLGILGAAALVGIPAIDVTDSTPPLGPWGPWLAVAVFGVGIVMNQCARPSSLGWIVLVLYVAYGAQVLGGLAFGGVLSAFVGAAAMTPAAALVARQRTGPPMIVSFTPAFWLLVPGALGLVGVAALLHGDDSGMSIVTSTVETLVAIALGVLVGRALSLFVPDRPPSPATPARPAEGAAEETV